MKIAVLGATGMLGSMVLDIFSKNTDYTLIATARDKSLFKTCKNTCWHIFDAQESGLKELEEIINHCDYAINCIGMIKPHIHDDNAFEVQRAIEVNALFPHKLAKIAEKYNIKVIQIATDCVYDGIKGAYIETDKHNALDVYGKTKSLGEVYSKNVMNLRCSIIGPELKGKTSLLEWFLNQPENAQINGFENHLWNGVTTLAFAKICLGLIKNNYWFSGLQHVIPAEFVTKAQMLADFADIYNRKDIKINNIEAKEAINRTILTNNQERNSQIWKNTKYKTIPTVKEMIMELNNSGNFQKIFWQKK